MADRSLLSERAWGRGERGCGPMMMREHCGRCRSRRAEIYCMFGSLFIFEMAHFSADPVCVSVRDLIGSGAYSYVCVSPRLRVY